MTGRIKTLVFDRYGFIRAEDGRDYFFHADDLADDDVGLRLGDHVSFEVVTPQSPRGPRARAVRFLEGPTS